jgi:hypothetical protein
LVASDIKQIYGLLEVQRVVREFQRVVREVRQVGED